MVTDSFKSFEIKNKPYRSLHNETSLSEKFSLGRPRRSTYDYRRNHRVSVFKSLPISKFFQTRRIQFSRATTDGFVRARRNRITHNCNRGTFPPGLLTISTVTDSSKTTNNSTDRGNIWWCITKTQQRTEFSTMSFRGTFTVFIVRCTPPKRSFPRATFPMVIDGFETLEYENKPYQTKP